MCDSTKKMKDSSVKNNVQDESTDQFCQKQSADKKESILKSTNEDVQRAIEGLKDIPDEELQEFLDDEDFMEGLDVVDAWEGDEEKCREVEFKTIHIKDQEQRRPSRDRHRRDYKGSYNRERPKREEKKHEEIRRDPSKSTKDIERDKIRTKRDNESKLLAEKEKAIKHLLDSDNVVPPGTEAEAIQSITERQNIEQAQMHIRRSRERRRSLERQRGSSLRRRTPDRIRLNSPRRKSPLILSPERCRSPFKISNERHRSPLRFSPDKRRSPRFNCARRSPFGFSPERRRSPIRRLSWERRTSTDRRWSAERHRRRINIHERRRSRSRDRQRSRSMERLRRKASRSPMSRRYSPRRRSRSRTRSRSLERRRKRSPFINELTRQLRNEAIMTSHMNTGYTHPPSMDGISPLMNNVYQQETEARPPIPIPPYMHQPGLAPPIQSNVTTGGPTFMNFENSSQPLNFDSVSMHPLPQTEYVSGPVMYNQPNTGSIQSAHRPALLPAPVSSPQHESAPSSVEHVQTYNSSHGISSTRQSPIQNFEFSNKSKDTMCQNYRERRFADSYNGYHASQEERLKTPEPPVISDTKQFEKTSLSSLLEASVSAKDSASLPVLYPGFKPEILRHCEHALRELPMEDPRLKMKGRFFYDPKKDNIQNKQNVYSSNSILLQKNKCKIYWEEEEEEQHLTSIKQNIQMHQKICQTDEVETSAKFVQASVSMVDFEIQVYPQDLQHAVKEEKRPIMDRLDWNMRETFDYTPKFREADDLRWSLSNSSQKRSWNRNLSPSRRIDDREHRMGSVSSLDHSSRNMKLGSPIRNRDTFSSHKGSLRNHYVRGRYSPNYRRSLEERDEFHENRSDHSRGESPMMLEDSSEELELEHTFQRGTNWHGRGKLSRGRSSPLVKPHMYRGKHSSGRGYRGRGNFRGKF